MGTKILVVGMNPSSRRRVYRNSTFDRLHRWFDAAGIRHYSFMNTFDEVDLNPRISKVDSDRFKDIDDSYVVLALGTFVSSVLKKFGVDHHSLPHPSPRNHKFNDPNTETDVIKRLKEIVYIDKEVC